MTVRLDCDKEEVSFTFSKPESSSDARFSLPVTLEHGPLLLACTLWNRGVVRRFERDEDEDCWLNEWNSSL